MSDKIKRVTPREIAEMLINEQAYQSTLFVLAEEHDAEIERLRARVVELRDLVGYLAGRNNDHIRVMLAGNPDACDRLIERARAALEAQP
jgi:hypothetical protein